MIIYSLKQLAAGIPTLFILVVLTFFLLRLAPGGPFETDKAWPPEIQRNIEAKYGLDQPLPLQFWNWFTDLMKGDLRESFQFVGKPVAEIIWESLPSSLLLGFCALILTLLIGIPLGAISAAKQNTWIDTLAMFFAISGVSLPSYLVASVVIMVFAMNLGWLPAALWEGPSSLILPVLTLSLRPIAIVARLARSSMIEALSSDYIRTAYAKGLKPFAIIFKHALKNSLIPVVTILGPIAATLVTGSFVIEVVFQLPGIGRHFVSAVLNRDYPLVMGVTLTYGIVLFVANLAVDIAYAWIDPRIRIREKT